MKTQPFRFILYAIIVYLTATTLNPAAAASEPSAGNGTHFCGVIDCLSDKRYSDQFPNRHYARTSAAKLNVGEPRTVRMIYFLPNDRPYRADVVQQMKDDIREIQHFYNEQMQAAGYGAKTFHVETDPQGDPVVHRVDGGHPDSHYLDKPFDTVLDETIQVFDLNANIYFTVLDSSADTALSEDGTWQGKALSSGKSGGFVLVFDEYEPYMAAHELGHTFELWHDFRDNAYIMSYGGEGLSRSRLSSCHAEFLSVHPYFNPGIPIEKAQPPTIELTSPSKYPAGSESVSIQLALNDSDGLHQVFLLVDDWGIGYEVLECRGLADEKDAIVEFDYDGYSYRLAANVGIIKRLADRDEHRIEILAVDTDGNVSEAFFVLEVENPFEQPRVPTLVKVSGINQRGPTNTPLAQPFVVEARDQYGNLLPGALITFSVIAGEGRFSGLFSAENATTDANGRIGRILTLGPNPGTNIVELAAPQLQGCEPVYFNARGIGVPTVSTMAGDYRTWHLPDNAIYRLGKGSLTDNARGVAFSPDGGRFAVASGIGVWFYDAATFRELALLPTAGGVYSMSFSPDGVTFATGAADGTIQLWDLATQEIIATLSGHNFQVTSVSFSPDGSTLASGDWDEMVKLWDVKTGHNIATLAEGPYGGVLQRIPVLFSPDGAILAAGFNNGTVKLWEAATQTQIVTLEGHRLGVLSLSFSSDGTTLATGSEDGTVRLWDVLTSVPITTLSGTTGHAFSVRSVSFSPDGTTLASCDWEGVVKLWDIATETNIATFVGHVSSVYSVTFSPDGATLVSGSKDGTVRLWDVETGNANTLYGHASWGNTASFSPDGRTLASGSEDGTIRLWDVETGRNIDSFGLHPPVVNGVSFSPDGKILASGSQWHTEVKLWDVATGANIGGFSIVRSQILSLSFSPDGTRIAAGDPVGVILWDVATGAHITTPLGQAPWVWSVAYSPDGAILAAGGADSSNQLGGRLQLWDASTLDSIATLEGHRDNVTSVSFSPDGRTLASGDKEETIKLWDVKTGRNVATLSERTRDGRRGAFFSVSFAPDGATLASGAHDGTIMLWDVATQRQITTLSGHTSWVYSLSFSPDGATLVSGSEDGTVLLWNIPELTLPLVEETIPNSQLRAAIRTALGLASDAPIGPTEVAALTELTPNATINSIGLSGITDLTGLELATNLRWLKFWNNSLSDISPVAGLTNLTSLTLWSDSLSDISPVADLKNLTSLELYGDSLSDISPVAGLTNLTSLTLTDNRISDLSPLVANTGLGTGDTVDVRANPLSYLSIHTHIPALRSRGVEVKFDNRAHPALLKISGDNQNGVPSTPLSQPCVIEAQDANGSALAGISVTFAVTKGGGTLNTTITITNSDGRAQSTLILGPNLGTNTVEVSAAGIESTATFYAITDSELPPTTADVNNDGSVNVLDLILIASSLGQSGQNDADINGDRVVSILDLVLAAGMFDEVAAAPSVQPQIPETLTAVEVQSWLNYAKSLEVKDAIMKRGFAVLEQLLISLTPRETELLANYPNPFNPETWIPYRLAEDAFVTLTIYDSNGQVVRTLDVGHRIASTYESQSKAVYWDGRNDLGEQVASGIYFYHLSAGEYSATRRMVILK